MKNLIHSIVAFGLGACATLVVQKHIDHRQNEVGELASPTRVAAPKLRTSEDSTDLMTTAPLKESRTTKEADETIGLSQIQSASQELFPLEAVAEENRSAWKEIQESPICKKEKNNALCIYLQTSFLGKYDPGSLPRTRYELLLEAAKSPQDSLARLQTALQDVDSQESKDAISFLIYRLQGFSGDLESQKNAIDRVSLESLVRFIELDGKKFTVVSSSDESKFEANLQDGKLHFQAISSTPATQ